MTYESPVETDTPKDIFDRILTIERTSWKGRAGEGFDTGPGADFYRDVIGRLHERGDLRVIFARHEGQDAGFVFGGVREQQYRGLQLSFTQGLETLEIGNILQWSMIQSLVEENVTTYDLGTEMPYKKRWAERAFETHMVAVMPYD